ncbi:hypothetical protein [Streptomyces sp. HC307]|uniref:hypothetical protein n=1 Tax=Streptomyces flavusporus TaxID=3385496 RepID=UPI0039170B8E
MTLDYARSPVLAPEECEGKPLRDAADQLHGPADVLEKLARVYQRMADQEAS